MLKEGEYKIRIKFVKIYSQGIWRRFYKFVVKNELRQEDVVKLMYRQISEQSAKRWFRKLRRATKSVDK